MSQKQQLAKLEQLSSLLLDIRLTTLQAAARAKLESETQLAGLTLPSYAPHDLSEIAAAMTALNYERWADARRAELNMLLARQTVTLMEARDAAREAFGKKHALGGLAQKLANRKRYED
ncbi:hypothetical protein GCM10010873_01660 [Cypionkella aquatica]|uniref:Uncharacterized protein n=1 Tax=Cypionkella aquatica TaxID=1756042 RepID=A0AA37TST6_9RHOB|nr:hypothetical protein [Cypionkella aquatica]GLS85193.1 hypothetical protein GCM10010873_01660 [Cypionkella aquatica]